MTISCTDLLPTSHSTLARARSANRPGSSEPHTVVVLPSYSVSSSLLARYAQRIPALEHRQLLAMLMLPLVPGSEMIFVTTKLPTERVLEYYLSLVPTGRRLDTRARIRLIEVPDPTPRSITAKLLDRPDLISEIRTMTRGRLAHIEPWNVTHLEMEAANRLGLPLNGTPPRLWPLGFKSNGRRLMRKAGVPLPLGHEGVRCVADIIAAAESIRRQHPSAAGVVIKLDDSGTGDGNRVVRFDESATTAALQDTVESLEAWYLAEIASGAVVEELVTGQQFASPSVQVDIAPGRRVTVVSTHEQLLGGANGQEYQGCRFPADVDYRSQVTSYGEAVGRLLANQGAMGRLCVDLAAAKSSGTWQLYGLEINLRKSGTSHPLTLLHSLVPGHYDDMSGSWSTDDGGQRCYRSTDSLIDPSWRGRTADDVINALHSAGLGFDRRSGIGAILHMFIGLDIDGLIGLTTIGHSAGHAEQLYEATAAALAM
jgi:ATP-grasp domain